MEPCSKSLGQILEFDLARQVFADAQVINGSFSVTWKGFVNPPKTGDYMFLLSPINVNSSDLQNPLKFTMTVSIGGKVVLNSVPDNSLSQSVWPDQRPWVSESNFVPLTAEKPIAFQVTAETTVPGLLPVGILHAVLSWKGPGIPTSLVPPESFTQTRGGNPGLTATYKWHANGKLQTLTRVEPAIDVAWTNSAILLSTDTSIAADAADAMWESATSDSFIAAIAGPPAKLHPFLKDPDDASAGLTTPRREAFLGTLLQIPALLEPMDLKQAEGFYSSFRIGTPDRALDVFGTWAKSHPDIVCDFSGDHSFDADVHRSLARMAIYTTQQYPGQWEAPAKGISAIARWTLFTSCGLHTRLQLLGTQKDARMDRPPRRQDRGP